MMNPHGQRITEFVASLIKGQPVPSGEAALTDLVTAAGRWNGTPTEFIEFGHACMTAAMERLAATASERAAAATKQIPEA